MATLIPYDRYTELLGKRIHKTITPAELAAVAAFETAQPKQCPKCNEVMHSFFLPAQIIHDAANCPANPQK